MDLRKSFLKPFRKLKDKLLGDRRKRDGRSRSETEGKGGKSEVEGSEASQRSSSMHPDIDIEDAMESGPIGEGSNVDGKGATPVDDPPTSTPSISRSGKPGGM